MQLGACVCLGTDEAKKYKKSSRSVHDDPIASFLCQTTVQTAEQLPV